MCGCFTDFGSAQYYIDSETLTHYVHAVRPIAVDEEITISCEFVPFLIL